MAENGVIFSDGIEKDFVDFNSGTKAIITVADRKGLSWCDHRSGS